MRARSLAGRLTLVLMMLTLAVAMVAGAWSYREASLHARELQDDVLLQVAGLAASAGSGRLTTDQEPLSNATADIDVAALAGSGLDPSTGPGLRTTSVKGVARRVAVAHGEAGFAVVASQPLAARDRIARDAALSAVLPLLVLLPLLAIALAVAVRRVLAPVSQLAADVDAREPSDLRPLEVGRAPQELQGLVVALNQQVDRAARAVAHERGFIAQAAHELRTPLTAVALQLDGVAAAVDVEQRGQRVALLRSGIRRSRHVIDQLLDLARAQVDVASPAATARVDVVVRDVVAQVLPTADLHGVEVEVEAADVAACAVPTGPTASALRNLLENAVTHGGGAGVVRIVGREVGDRLEISVEDGGPGMVDPLQLSAPFIRGRTEHDGSGLGLAIVSEQMARIGGTVEFHGASSFPSGTRAVLRIPVRPGGRAPSSDGGPEAPRS